MDNAYKKALESQDPDLIFLDVREREREREREYAYTNPHTH